jgi:hypothetical protein
LMNTTIGVDRSEARMPRSILTPLRLIAPEGQTEANWEFRRAVNVSQATTARSLIPLDKAEPPEMAMDALGGIAPNCTRGRPIIAGSSHAGAPIKHPDRSAFARVGPIFSGSPQRIGCACQVLPPTCVLKSRR